MSTALYRNVRIVYASHAGDWLATNPTKQQQISKCQATGFSEL
jgi:hypothetical protein